MKQQLPKVFLLKYQIFVDNEQVTLKPIGEVKIGLTEELLQHVNSSQDLFENSLKEAIRVFLQDNPHFSHLALKSMFDGFEPYAYEDDEKKYVLLTGKMQENGLWGMPTCCYSVSFEEHVNAENEYKFSALVYAIALKHKNNATRLFWISRKGFFASITKVGMRSFKFSSFLTTQDIVVWLGNCVKVY